MHVPLTIAVFILLAAAMIVLRARWSRLADRTRRRITFAAVSILALQACSTFSGYDTAFDHFNYVVLWAVLTAYLFFLMRFSLLRPRWFTALIALVLWLPLFSTSIFLRFAETLAGFPRSVTSLGGNVYTETIAWRTDPSESSGADFSIYAVPPHLPFLRHHLIGLRLFNRQCDTAHAIASLSPDHKHVLYTCPPPLQHPEDPPVHTQQPLN